MVRIKNEVRETVIAKLGSPKVKAKTEKALPAKEKVVKELPVKHKK